MSSTNLNIRTDKGIKEKADAIYAELGLSMTAAINLFLRASIRAKGIPFDLKLEPNSVTAQAIDEGRRIAHDPSVKGYRTIEALKDALDV